LVFTAQDQRRPVRAKRRSRCLVWFVSWRGRYDLLWKVRRIDPEYTYLALDFMLPLRPVACRHYVKWKSQHELSRHKGVATPKADVHRAFILVPHGGQLGKKIARHIVPIFSNSE
jgi:hypothetical protein